LPLRSLTLPARRSRVGTYNLPTRRDSAGAPKESPMQKSKARRKAAKVRRKRRQNTHFKLARVSTKERFK
jgi:hypothetical protein